MSKWVLIPNQYADHIEIVTESGCWIWMRSTGGRGYGAISVNGKELKAHRVIYESIKGPIPEGLVLDHLCRVRCCVNPDHLEPVTHRENTMRGVGASAKNLKKTHCKMGHELTEDNIYRLKNDPYRWCRICKKESWHKWSANRNARRVA